MTASSSPLAATASSGWCFCSRAGEKNYRSGGDAIPYSGDSRPPPFLLEASRCPDPLTLVVLFALWSGAALAVDSQDTLLLAQPDISERNITFVYDGDVWVANRDGSAAYRLTTAEGQESLPHFSPDGASIAFSGNYDGNIDVYVVPIAGGSPKRLTWHSADDLVEGFDDRGRVVFSSQSDVQTARDVHLFAIDPTLRCPSACRFRAASTPTSRPTAARSPMRRRRRKRNGRPIAAAPRRASRS